MNAPNTAETAKKLIGHELTVEGTYYAGVGAHGDRGSAKPFTVTMLLPPEWNRNGQGLTYVHRVIGGEITGTPFLVNWKDAKGKTPYSDYKAKRTVNIADWLDVYDPERIPEIVSKASPEHMSMDALKNELSNLGITYPNPARKIELQTLLEQARGKPKPKDPTDDRPDFGAGQVENGLPKDPNGEGVVVGQLYAMDSSIDPNSGLPKQTNVTMEPDGKRGVFNG